MGTQTPLITPEAFTAAMTDRWHAFGNTSSPKLQSLWHAMAVTFNRAADGSDKPNSPWLVLEPPTGSGKTEGLCVYAALAVRANDAAAQRLGTLVVTRTIEQANGIVDTIRKLVQAASGGTMPEETLKARVVAKHSANTTTASEMRAADVLVICHAAYTNALGGIVKDTALAARWQDYVEWRHGPRRLTVIDEALAGIVEEHQVKAEHLRQALAYIDDKLRSQFPAHVKALEYIGDLLVTISRKTAEESADRSARIVWRAVYDGRAEFPKTSSMDEIRAAMRPLRYDLMSLRKDSPTDRQRIADFVDDTLKATEAVMAKWAYYHKIGAEPTFNASQLLIPPGLPGPVILDATASQNFLWELMDGRAEIVATEKGARSYANVTLHAVHSQGTGKQAMRDEAEQRVPRLLAHLARELPADSKVLVVCHKAIEHRLLSWEHPFAAFSVAHWGAIDGKNDWQGHDTIVLFGLPWRPDTWANNAFFALRGLPTSNDWMTKPAWRSYPDVRMEMERRQMAVEIIQAINRVRCRRVVDAEGGCLPTAVYAVLPPGAFGDQLAESLAEEMPGLVSVPWEYTLDGPAERIRRGSSHDALLALMRNRLPGETSMSKVGDELGLSASTSKDLKAVLRNPEHDLTKALAEIGVEYRSTGAGRAARSYLVKA